MRVNEETGLKKCSVCGIEKALDEFSLSRSRFDGHNNMCKICARLKNKTFYASHLETEREKRKIYREANRDKNKVYRETHKEQISESQKEWRKENKEEISKRAKEYRERNLERLRMKAREKYQRNKRQIKNYSLQSLYGISIEELDFMFETQNSTCSVCGREITREQGGYAIDHDHKTGKVRGLLCAQCNFILGHAHDNPEILKSLALYLENGGR